MKYEGKFHFENTEEILYITFKIFNKDGKINSLSTSFSGFKSQPDILINEVVVPYKNKQNNNDALNNSLSKEVIRVLKKMPPIELPDSYKKTIGIPLKLVPSN